MAWAWFNFLFSKDENETDISVMPVWSFYYFCRAVIFIIQCLLLSSFRICCEKTSYVSQCIEHLGLGSWTLLFFFINDEQANSYVATSHHLIYQVLFSLFCLLTCTHLQTEIGWRENSRKMLLFSTDAGFHYVGDGKVFILRLNGCTVCHPPYVIGKERVVNHSEWYHHYTL